MKMTKETEICDLQVGFYLRRKRRKEKNCDSKSTFKQWKCYLKSDLGSPKASNQADIFKIEIFKRVFWNVTVVISPRL